MTKKIEKNDNLTPVNKELKECIFSFFGLSPADLKAVSLVSKAFCYAVLEYAQNPGNKREGDLYDLIQKHELLLKPSHMHFLVTSVTKSEQENKEIKARSSRFAIPPQIPATKAELSIATAKEYCTYALCVHFNKIDYPFFKRAYFYLLSQQHNQITQPMTRALSVIGLFLERSHCTSDSKTIFNNQYGTFIEQRLLSTQTLPDSLEDIRKKIDNELIKLLCVQKTSFLNLHGADFSDGYFYYKDFTTEHKYDGSARGANLSGAMMREAKCICTDFSYANFLATNMEEIVIENSNIYGARLVKIKCKGGVMFDVFFTNSQLTEIPFHDAEVTRCDFSGVHSMKKCFFSKDQATTQKLPVPQDKLIKFPRSKSTSGIYTCDYHAPSQQTAKTTTRSFTCSIL